VQPIVRLIQPLDGPYSLKQDAFRQHSPGSKAPAPKTLRSIFITWMRSQCENDADMKEVLRSAAVTMKHRETTSGSDVYDKGEGSDVAFDRIGMWS
jgi:hypothetical protein